jgi:hypothetical protein
MDVSHPNNKSGQISWHAILCPTRKFPRGAAKKREQKQNAMSVQLRNESFPIMACLRISSEPKMSSNQCLINVRSRHSARLGRGAGKQLILVQSYCFGGAYSNASNHHAFEK